MPAITPDPTTTAGPVSPGRVTGATIESEYVARKMKVYAVVESDLELIAWFSTLSTFFFSLGASCISLALGIWLNDAAVATPTPQQNVLDKDVAWGLIILGIIFMFIGCLAFYFRGAKWKKIFKDTVKKEKADET